MTSEWFRNSDWSAAIAEQFFLKLKRARRKEQYLLIQSGMLAAEHPAAALELLERYFTLPDQFDQAQAHVNRATALVALGRIEDAISALRAALQREAEFPTFQTEARLRLPFLIASRQLRKHYDVALSALNSKDGPLLFPVERFMWHSAAALIANDNGEAPFARDRALDALKAANEEHSGLRYHPAFGLVSRAPFDVMERLRAISEA